MCQTGEPGISGLHGSRKLKDGMARKIKVAQDFRETEWSKLEAKRATSGGGSPFWLSLIEEVDTHAKWMIISGISIILAITIALYHWPALMPIGFALVLAVLLLSCFLHVLNLAKVRELDERQAAISQALLGIDEQEVEEVEV